MCVWLQVHTNIIIFIVHLNDDDAEVRKACLAAFKQVADLLSPEIVAALDDYEPEPHTYDEVVGRLAPLLVATFPGRIRSYVGTAVEYFGSPWTGIRGNAAIIGALLTASTNQEVRKTVNTNSLCQELIRLLGQKEELVRALPFINPSAACFGFVVLHFASAFSSGPSKSSKSHEFVA